MKDSWIGQVGVWGQRHYQYLIENKPTVLSVMRMNNTMKQYLREADEAMNEMHSLSEVEAFSYGFRLGIRLMIEAVVPLAKGTL